MLGLAGFFFAVTILAAFQHEPYRALRCVGLTIGLAAATSPRWPRVGVVGYLGIPLALVAGAWLATTGGDVLLSEGLPTLRNEPR